MRARAVVIALGVAASTNAQAPAAADVDSFRLHKFAQPIGWEIGRRTRAGDSTITSVDFLFVDRGSTVPLTATMVTASDGAARHLALHGRVSRFSTIDQAVDLTADGDAFGAQVRSDSTRRTVAGRGPVFAISGYSPVSAQQALVYYWLLHGRPDSLPTLPGGWVRVRARGRDTVPMPTGRRVFDRYAIDGLVWGQETVWMDGANRLAALVTRDAEFDHFEAVRAGLEPALGRFISSGARDGVAALAALARGGAASPGRAYALVGGTLVDGNGGPPLSDAVVVVRDGRIVAAGPRARVHIPAGLERVSVAGRTILPGLWDMHAHYEQVEWGPIYLASGVTTVRDVGNVTEFITAVRDAIDAGRGLGPHLVLAGLVDGTGPYSLGVTRVDTPDEVARAVAHYHALGYRQIKIYSSVAPAMVPRIVRAAHAAGMTVTGHIPTGMDAVQALDAGMDGINHVEYLAEVAAPDTAAVALDTAGAGYRRMIAALRRHPAVIDPTLAVFEWGSHAASTPVSSFEPGVDRIAAPLRDLYANSGVPELYAARAARAFAIDVALVGALHRDGVTIVAGTDQTVPGHSLHRELELYVQAGFTPMEAIMAATSVPAKALGLDREVGTVTAGKRADLLVVDGDPLTHISDTRRVALVISNGVRYDPAPLWRMAGFEP